LRIALVTGANGFMGRALCTRILAEGWHVQGTFRSSKRSDMASPNLDAIKIESIGPDTDCSKALDGVDTVVYLAARVYVMNDTASDPHAAFRWVNVKGTERLAQQAVDANVRRLVFYPFPLKALLGKPLFSFLPISAQGTFR